MEILTFLDLDPGTVALIGAGGVIVYYAGVIVAAFVPPWTRLGKLASMIVHSRKWLAPKCPDVVVPVEAKTGKK